MYTVSVKAARINADLSAEEACKRLGIGRTTLWSYEIGKSKPPINIIKKMIDVYQVPYEHIRY